MTLGSRVDHAFWRGRRVLVTGHTGFKGAWLSHWLTRLGAQVYGLALPPQTNPSLYELAQIAPRLAGERLIDLANEAEVRRFVVATNPDVVFHLAAQALVRRGYREPVNTFTSNVLGAVHLLDSLRECSALRALVMVSTDKVYASREWPWPYRETDRLGGLDPYSASKAAAELVVESYRQSYFEALGVRVAQVRAGNVIGGGDWAEDRLVPDLVRAWTRSAGVELRKPGAIRPWQHVLEPLAVDLVLAQALYEGRIESQALNVGPPAGDAVRVEDLVQHAQALWGSQAQVVWPGLAESTDKGLASTLLSDAKEAQIETQRLTLDTSRLQVLLQWAPRWDWKTALGRTLDWYRHQQAGASVQALCDADLQAFEEAPQ